MLRMSDGSLFTDNECSVKNKSAFISNYHDRRVYLHNIVNYVNKEADDKNTDVEELQLYNRQIDKDTFEVLKEIIDYGNGYDGNQTAFKKIKIYCCRELKDNNDLKFLKNNPELKNIEVFKHPKTDIFHDRILCIKRKAYSEIYLMGNALSSLKRDILNLAQMTGSDCFNPLHDYEKNLLKWLHKLTNEAERHPLYSMKGGINL